MNDDSPSSGLAVRSQGGFTIVETLIVLAVSSALLLSAIALVLGQQRRVEFSQAAQDIRSIIEQDITEVGSGYYPNIGNLSCSASGGSVNIATGNGTPQGSNTGCIFLGRALQFGNGGDQTKYVVHTLAGLQANTGTLATAKPQAVDIDTARDYGSLRNGLKAVSMNYVVNGSATPISTVAFVNGLGDYGNGQLLSGSQQMSLVPVPGSGTVATADIPATVSKIAKLDDTTPVDPNGGVQICFQSGGTNQSALVTIGSNNRNLSVKLDIKDSVDCT